MSKYASIVFNRSGYDPFIDYLKAFSIVFVLLAHSLSSSFQDKSLFYVWGDMQVPMFVLIQTFHAYKAGIQPNIKATYIFKRIVLPFLAIQLFLISVLLVVSSQSPAAILSQMYKGGGLGPGTYYVWIYLQLAILLPLIWKWINSTNKNIQLLFFVVFSIGVEVLFSYVNMPDYIYRLLATRYVFLIYLAYQLWVVDNIIINFKTIAISIISIIAVLFFAYSNYNLEPLFYNTGWAYHRWICYYYVSTLLVFLFWKVYHFIRENKKINSMVVFVGKCSYEIFLVQMIVFALYPISLLQYICPDFRDLTFVLSSIVVSIIGGGIFKTVFVDKLILKK